MNTMNGYLVAAAAIAFVVGLVHSVLGEMLIFRRLRQGHRLVPTNGGNLLGERHVRILWASWHLVTMFGWAMGTVLLQLALPSSSSSASTIFVPHAIAIATLAGSALVFIGTRARHPGWIGLLGMAVCVWLSLTI